MTWDQCKKILCIRADNMGDVIMRIRPGGELVYISPAIEQMIGFMQSWQNAKISMDRLNEIHTLEDEEPEHRELQQQLPAAFARQLMGGPTYR
ncbi:MAG: hypothetical protein EOO04_01530, partial [Chitinophagaceae bacterium]